LALKIISKNNLNIDKLNPYFFFVNFHFLVSHDPAIFYTIKRNRIHIFSNAFHGDFEKIPGLKGMNGKSLANG